jgi:GNAT superfamily N-acetyltransferase
MEIVELQTEEEFREAFPLMHELRPALTLESFLAITGDMVWDGYRLFGGREDGRLVALAGVAVCLNLYHGRHLWVYDLVTAPDVRSQGHGRALLLWLEDLARREGCERLALCSGVRRLDAHRFYEERMGYERASHLFVKKLDA